MSTAEKVKEPVTVASKEEPSAPSTTNNEQTEEDSEPRGLILEDGSINWDCPCLGGMVKGPCGDQFREAFSCFHYSKVEPKGSDCMQAFTKMQDCMQKYPEIYGPDEKDEEALEEELEEKESEKPVIDSVDKTSITTSNSSEIGKQNSSNDNNRQKLDKSKS